jgi:hypothetical protein
VTCVVCRLSLSLSSTLTAQRPTADPPPYFHDGCASSFFDLRDSRASKDPPLHKETVWTCRGMSTFSLCCCETETQSTDFIKLSLALLLSTGCLLVTHTNTTYIIRIRIRIHTYKFVSTLNDASSTRNTVVLVLTTQNMTHSPFI